MGMRRKELLLTLVFAHLLGLGLFFVLSENSALSLNSLIGKNRNQSQSNAIEAGKIMIEKKSLVSAGAQVTENQPSQIAAQAPILGAPASGEDYEDALLLYSALQPTLFDENYCKIAEFYGLICARVNLDQIQITEELLKDFSGEFYKLIGIQAQNLLQSRSLVDGEELSTIINAVEAGGANLLISELNEKNFPDSLVTLTDGALQGIIKPLDSTKDWIVSETAPEITLEFTGQTFLTNSTSSPQDFALALGNEGSITELISSKDDSQAEYMIFAVLGMGDGMLYLDASQPSPIIGNYPMRELLYTTEWFSRLIPLMITARSSFAEEAWHNDRNFANLMIDNMWLGDDVPGMDYLALLREMQSHRFHTTLGFIPTKWDKSETLAVSIFRANPDLFSISQYGNNADGYEFYKYEVTTRDWLAGDPKPARPFEDQAADIEQGLERLETLRAYYGIPYDKVMIFPGIPPEQTIGLLKQLNYLATVNASTVPLGSTRPEYWDYGMYQANLDFENFPMLSRRYLGALEAAQEDLQYLIINLFIDKPALMYSSAGRLFNGEMEAFSPFADDLNGLEGDLEWKSLGFVVRHLYLEKLNDDGSINIKMVSNNLIVKNDSSRDRQYHVLKDETLQFAIAQVFVDGQAFLYDVVNGVFQVNLTIPAGVEVEIEILYET